MDNEKETTDAVVAEELEGLGRFSKPEAPSLELFLADPLKYRPRQEFLGGPASYAEVTDK